MSVISNFLSSTRKVITKPQESASKKDNDEAQQISDPELVNKVKQILTSKGAVSLSMGDFTRLTAKYQQAKNRGELKIKEQRQNYVDELKQDLNEHELSESIDDNYPSAKERAELGKLIEQRISNS